MSASEFQHLHTAVAVPARDEAFFIRPCLEALAAQTLPADDILLLVNNTSDGTAEIARRMAQHLPGRLHVEKITIAAHQANAGYVRRRVMDKAAALVGPQGAVLTTDADTRVPPDWIARNISWLYAGYDAVCGRALIDPADEAKLPAALVEDDAAEALYGLMLEEVNHHIDPCRWIPWPRHRESSGASIAVRAAVYRAVGGLPKCAYGEDRAFAALLEARDCKIMRDPEIQVIVSGRSVGRAEGGMATTIARRLLSQDYWADERLEPPVRAVQRATLRRQLRAAWQGHRALGDLPAQLKLAEAPVLSALRRPWFGTSWNTLEALSPVLRREKVPMTALPALIAAARPVLDALREEAHPLQPGSPASAVGE